jgi:hypothetical protein
MMTATHCTCGCNPPHSDPRHCEASRRATVNTQKRANFPPPLRTIRNEFGQFVRFPRDDEDQLPHGASVSDGRIS